jgi:hypothetical protein
MHMKGETQTEFLVNRKGRDHLRDLDVDRRITLIKGHAILDWLKMTSGGELL